MKKAIASLLGRGAVAMGYDAGESNRARRDLGWDRRTPRDEDHAANDQTRSIMRQRAADLRRNNPTVAGVGDRLALWTVGAQGIIPQARTSDTGWNRAAEQWWAEYGKSCDSRGRSSLWDFQNMAVSLRPTHGGMYFEKIDDGTLRPIECERIRQPQDPERAKAYIDGVRVDTTTGKIIDFCVHSRDRNGTFSDKHPEQYVTVANMLRAIRPAWRPDQVREIPDLAPVIPTLQDIDELNKYVLNTAKVQSTFIGFLKKIGGATANALPRGSNPTNTAGARPSFKLEWGEMLTGQPGEEMEMQNSPTPGQNHIPHIKMHLALCASALNMPYEFFTLDLSGLDFSRQKGMLLLVNYAVRPWRRWLVDSFLNPLWQWRVAMAMRGDLSPAPTVNGVSEWARVDWQYPAEITIDRQQDMQADVLEIQAGFMTLGQGCKRRGVDFEDQLRMKAEEQKLINEIAEEYDVDPSALSKMQIPGQTDAGEKKEEEPIKADDEKGVDSWLT